MKKTKFKIGSYYFSSKFRECCFYKVLDIDYKNNLMYSYVIWDSVGWNSEKQKIPRDANFDLNNLANYYLNKEIKNIKLVKLLYET